MGKIEWLLLLPGRHASTTPDLNRGEKLEEPLPEYAKALSTNA